MNVEPGIYHVKFTASSRDFGEGLAVFKDGKINGGDPGYLYLGAYEMTGLQIAAKIKVKRWNPAVTSVFGNLAEFDLDLSGTITADDAKFAVTGFVVQNRQQKISIDGRRLADAL